MNQPTIKNDLDSLAVRSKNLLLTLAIVLLASIILPMPGLTGLSGYLPLHILMESIAIVIATMVYVVGWHTYQTKPGYRTLALSCLFLGVAVLDFSHMLSFDGMPALVTESSTQKAVNFWLAARTFALVGLICAALLPHKTPAPLGRYGLLAIVVLLLAGIHIWILFFPESLPVSYVEGEGLTNFKIVYELGLTLAFAAVAFYLWRHSKQSPGIETLMLATSAAIMAMSEVFFALYVVTSDMYNLLGHIYKIIAYGLLYRALVVTGIEEPVKDVERLGRRIQATLDALPDMMFEISADGTICQYHSNVSQDELLVPPEVFLGKNLGEFLPENAIEACRQAMSDIEETGRSDSRQYSLDTVNGVRWYEISGAGMKTLDNNHNYILMVRDVTQRYLSEQRTQLLLNLASDSASLDESELARKALDNLEKMTQSRIGFLHMVSEDQEEIELLAWSTATGQHYCNAEYNNHYPVSTAGIWADSVRERRAIVVNDYASASGKKGLPDGHSELKRFVSVPVFEDNKVRMILGVGNADVLYDDDVVNTLALFGNELYQIIQRRRAQRDAERNQRILKAALDHLPVGVAINSVGEEVRFEYMNDNFPLFYRTTREILSNTKDFWDVVYQDPEQRERVRRRVLEDFRSGIQDRMKWDYVPLPKEGHELRYINAQNVVVPEEHLSVSLVVDVTEQKLAESELRIAATAFASQEGIMITGADQKILRVNAAFERITGYTQDEVLGKTPSFFSSGRNPPQFYSDMWQSIATTGGWRGEIWNKRKNGEVYPQSLTITAVRNESGDVTNYVGDFLDISELKNAEQEISRLSYFDSLTGLPNRDQLQTILNNSISDNLRNNKNGALLIIDLDHFKTLNDTMGHDAGDKLLVQVAERLRKVAGADIKVARYGGDEFVLVINDLDIDSTSAAEAVNQKAQAVLAALEDNYNIDGNSYYTTSSIGATLYGLEPTTAGELMRQADIGLSQAKTAGRNQISFFDPALESAISERAQLLADMRVAIQQQQFELYVQPQQDISGVIIGAEALVRWNHPTRGLVSPGDFIPLAESSGLMLPLGREIMRMGLDILQGWQQLDYCAGLKLSLNLAAQQFHEADFADVLLQELDQKKLNADRLILEFTESTLLDNFAQTRLNMQRLSEQGVEFAIDDFGTGYSSLAYLSELPLDQLKIDQSFVRNMATRPKDKAIVRTIIDMAYSMGMGVLAEGVETDDQRRMLLAQGCMLYQGYLIGRPEKNSEFINRMMQQSLLPAPSSTSLPGAESGDISKT